MPSRPKSHVTPVWVTYWDCKSQADVRRIVAYRAVCGCEWRGRPWKTWVQANAERRYHQGEHDDV